MAILVTGGAGYIGSVAVKDLQEKGENVIVVDNLVYGHRSAVDKTVPFYEGNIGDQRFDPKNFERTRNRSLYALFRLCLCRRIGRTAAEILRK